MSISSEYRNTFTTVAGKKVLDDLRQEFYDRSLARDEPHKVHEACGAHGVIRYILDMLEDRTDADKIPI